MMKYNLLICNLIVLILTCQGQIPTHAKRLSLPKFELDSSNRNQIFIEFGFGGKSYKNSLEILRIYRYRIDSIYLLYSDFPKNANLNPLNSIRFESLRYFFPALDSIPISIVRQTACQTKDEAKKLPHGFVFFLTKPKKPIRYRGIKNDLVYGRWDRDTTVLASMTQDTTLEKILVCDLTASMYGHILQVILWQIRENKRIKGIICYNDGDSLPNNQKKLGSTGGIYYIENKNLDYILSEMDKVIAAGDGNDLPENNIEALLYAQNRFPGLPIIHITDARPNIRDIALMDQIKSPLKIILARTDGYWSNINPDYISLAIKTKGSLHYGDKIISDTVEMKKLKSKIIRRWKKILETQH